MTLRTMQTVMMTIVILLGLVVTEDDVVRTVAVKMFLFLVTNPRCIESTAPQELSHACRNAVRRGNKKGS
jgi:hypothetical protein